MFLLSFCIIRYYKHLLFIYDLSHLFIGVFTLVTVSLLFPIKETKDDAEKMDNVFMVFIPHYCLGKSFINMYLQYSYRVQCLNPKSPDVLQTPPTRGKLFCFDIWFENIISWLFTLYFSLALSIWGPLEPQNDLSDYL